MKELIKKFNAWMEEVGVDKLLHFLLTAWLVSEAKVYGLFPMMMMFLALVVLGLLKERCWDEELDGEDLLWSVCGGLLSILLYVPYDLLH